MRIARVTGRASRAIAAAVAITMSLGAVSCRESAQPITLAVPGRSNQFATMAARGDFVAVAWGASTSAQTDVYASTSRDGGATFSAPARVNAVEGDARVAGEQPPQVALVARGSDVPEIVVVWAAKRADGSRLLTAHSSDGGTTFSATEVVRGTEAVGNRGWHSVTVDTAGHIMVLWLDHRNAAASMGVAHQHGAAGGTAATMDPTEKAEQSQVMFTTLGDTQPRAITGGVCYCCKTALASKGNMIFAAWRHVFPGSQRDIAFAASRDGGATFSAPVRVSEDHWAFDGCPENGPAIAIDSAKRVHVAWVTPLDGTPDSPLALYHATSSDGVTFTPRARIETKGAAFHVRLVAEQGGAVLVAWEEQVTGARAVRLARIGSSGVVKQLASGTDATGAYPAIAATAPGTIVAWMRGSGSASTIGVVRVR